MNIWHDIAPERITTKCLLWRKQRFCFETQGYPDAVNHSHFPTTILKAREWYSQTTIFCFSV